MIRHPARNLLGGIQKLRLSRKNIAHFQPVSHALPKFQLHRIRMLLHPRRLIHEHTGILPVKQIQKGYGILIEVMDIAVEIQQILKFINLFLKLRNLGFHPVRLLGMESVS